MSDIHLSEIFPITFDSSLNLISFRLSPEVGQEIGNSLGWHFSKQFPGVVVIWLKEYFWILARIVMGIVFMPGFIVVYYVEE